VIQSPVLRAVLVLVLLAFAVFCAQIAWTEGGPGTFILIALALGALTFAVGLIFPGRRRIALRAVAGGAAALYAAYWAVEVWYLLRGDTQSVRIGQPSALSACIGALIWGIPLLVYALSGRTLREHRVADSFAADGTGELRDRHTLAALEAAGADLSLPTEVNFYLEVPSRAHAESIFSVGQRRGLQAEIHGDAVDDPVTVCLGTQLVPSWENIRRARADFERLASEYGGILDGWDARARTAAPPEPAV
jgi:hypothetical protein